MTMVNMPRRGNEKMPRAPNVPNNLPNRLPDDDYAEEAKRAAQRHYDQVQQIEALKQDVEEWRRKALILEDEVKRLEKREHDLTIELHTSKNELEHERDSYKHRLVMLVAQFESAGAVILRCLDAAKAQAGPQVNLEALAAEIDKVRQVPPPPAIAHDGPMGLDESSLDETKAS
jgi:hypothetical protein